MSATGVQLAIDKIAKDIIALARAILEDDNISVNPKINQNTLKNSMLHRDINTIIKSQIGEDIVIDALFNHYVEYLERERPAKKGKKPPIDELKEWAAANGIPTDANTLWAVATAIWRDGHKGRPIFATMDKKLDGLYMDNWAEELKEALVDHLDNFFND